MVPCIRVSRVGRDRVTLTVIFRVSKEALSLESGIVLSKYHCEYGTPNSNIATHC